MEKNLMLNVLACLMFVAFGVFILWDITKKFTTIKTFSESNNYKLYGAGIVAIFIGLGLLYYSFFSN